MRTRKMILSAISTKNDKYFEINKKNTLQYKIDLHDNFNKKVNQKDYFYTVQSQ